MTNTSPTESENTTSAGSASAVTASAVTASAEATPDSGIEESPDERAARVARLVLEDFVVTALLSRGRALRHAEIAGAAEGFSVSRNGLKDGLEGSPFVELVDRDWELSLRLRHKGLPREERSRAPLESTLRTLMQEFGKPLPTPVIVRELSLVRGTYPETLRDSVAHVLRSSRWAVEVRENTYLDDAFLLDAGAPREELVIRENGLRTDPDFAVVDALATQSTSGTLAERAARVLETAQRPLSQKLLGFVLYRQNPGAFDTRLLAKTLGDRSQF